MTVLAYAVVTAVFLLMPVERSEPPKAAPFVGRYVGASAFTPADPADSAYAETVDVWFIFDAKAYVYGEGDTIPEDEAGDGGGPYRWTDSTVTLEGAYPKILRPAIVLRGAFTWRVTGDTLFLSQPSAAGAAAGYRLRLVRQ